MAHCRPSVKGGPADKHGRENMSLVKKIVILGGLLLAAAWAL